MVESKKVHRLGSANTQRAHHCSPFLHPWQTSLIDHGATEPECCRSLDVNAGYPGLGYSLKYDKRRFYFFVLLNYTDNVGTRVCLKGGHFDHITRGPFPPVKIPQYLPNSATSEHAICHRVGWTLIGRDRMNPLTSAPFVLGPG